MAEILHVHVQPYIDQVLLLRLAEKVLTFRDQRP
jgi:hypothetical protein